MQIIPCCQPFTEFPQKELVWRVNKTHNYVINGMEKKCYIFFGIILYVYVFDYSKEIM